LNNTCGTGGSTSRGPSTRSRKAGGVVADGRQNSAELCAWHHFGHFEGGYYDEQRLAEALGPSLALGRHRFEETFGDELVVLVPVQDFLLAKFAEDQWPEYNLPRQLVNTTRRHWIELKHAANT
jgi:hypothetical protein